MTKVDIISNLPDPILHLILSRVPTTEEVARTSILSTRWRYLWTSVSSIDIDYSRGLKPFKKFRENKFKNFVCRVLEDESIDLDSLRLSCGNYYGMITVEEWIEAAVKRNVKVLVILNSGRKEYGDKSLPVCLVTCGSLEVLRLSFAIRISFPKDTSMPALRVLELKDCKLFDENSVNGFLKSCPLLEDLSLIDSVKWYLSRFCISCSKLKNLRIINQKRQEFLGSVHRYEGMCDQLQICCPELVFLELACTLDIIFIAEIHDSLKKAVIHSHDTFDCPWRGFNICEFFAGISHVESLSLHICSINQYIDLEDFPEFLPNLKTLEVTTTIEAENMDLLIRILTCSHNLESLHVTFDEAIDASSSSKVSSFDFSEMECTFKELKMVKVTDMSAVPYHMGFVQFLLESTPFLEIMNITPCMNMTDGGISFLTNSVLKFSRASPQVEIIFVQDHV